jgi:hypothetical protein
MLKIILKGVRISGVFLTAMLAGYPSHKKAAWLAARFVSLHLFGHHIFSARLIYR